MKSGKHILSLVSALLLFCSAMNAQQMSSSTVSATVPRLVNFSGKATDIQGKTIPGIAGAPMVSLDEPLTISANQPFDLAAHNDVRSQNQGLVALVLAIEEIWS